MCNGEDGLVFKRFSYGLLQQRVGLLVNTSSGLINTQDLFQHPYVSNTNDNSKLNQHMHHAFAHAIKNMTLFQEKQSVSLTRRQCCKCMWFAYEAYEAERQRSYVGLS